MPELPARPSAEHLRKAAKRRARERSLPLADAQRQIACDYGFRTWADIMRHVASLRGELTVCENLYTAVRARDLDAVQRFLADGANPQHGNVRTR